MEGQEHISNEEKMQTDEEPMQEQHFMPVYPQVNNIANFTN